MGYCVARVFSTVHVSHTRRCTPVRSRRFPLWNPWKLHERLRPCRSIVSRPPRYSARLCRTHYAKKFLKIFFDFARYRIVFPALRVSRMKTHRHRPEVWVREHERVREPPGRVAAGVVHQDTGVGAVGHVHEHVVAVAEESILQTRHVRLVVDDQVGQQRVGSQDFSR